MKPVRRAVIDVGTNSVKLLVADVAGRDVQPVLEQSRQTRLGRGFYETHRLQPQAIAQTAKAVAAFAALAREQQALSIRVIATSAARDAKNRGELTSAIEQASGLAVQIISGDREAELAFRGVTTDPALGVLPLLILDVGGGSSQFIVGSGARKDFQGSYPLGSVRLIEKLPHSDPPTPEELARCRQWLRGFLDEKIRPELEPALRQAAESGLPERSQRAHQPEAVQLVGTGGTASILACMDARLARFDRTCIEAARLNLMQLRAHLEHLWSLPAADRKKVAGVPPNRADVILYGVAIYEAVMAGFGFAGLRVSTRGLRFGAVLEDD